MASLAACGGSDRTTDDDDTSAGSGAGSTSASTGSGSLDTAYMRATLTLTEGGERLLDVPSQIEIADTVHLCGGNDSEGWGVGVGWEPGAPPAEGEHALDELGTYPQMIVSFPKPSGGYRFSFVGSGTLTITSVGSDFIEGTFGGIVFTPNDADDIVSGVPSGSFRCEGAL